jgi:Holliday junction resolvasome RuvABC ATP-dependent DNA helicase subunit
MHSLYTSGMKHVKPNRVTYNSVINAWAKSTEKGSGRKAEKLLRRLFDFYEVEGGEELKPDARSFNSVINTGEY